MKLAKQHSPFEQAQHVLRVTTEAWGIKPESAHALARRAPHGYESFRARRRRFSAAVRSFGEPQWLAHSW